MRPAPATSHRPRTSTSPTSSAGLRPRVRRTAVLGPHEVAGVTESGLVVGPGTGDNAGAALGLGLRPGDVVVSLGTSGAVFADHPVPVKDPSGDVAGFASASGGTSPDVHPQCRPGADRGRTAPGHRPHRAGPAGTGRRTRLGGSPCCPISTGSARPTFPRPPAPSAA